MRAVDFAGYTRIPTAQDIANLQAIGVTRAIVGTRGNRRNFVAQVSACLAAGFDVQAFVYLYWNEPAVTQAMNALALVRQTPITMVWVDVETDQQNAISGNPCDLVDSVLATLQPYETGIYTSRTMWADITDDTIRYSHLPLWDANYGTEGGPFFPYGGWMERSMHQYAGSVDIDGLNVDLNTVEGRMYSDRQIDEKLTNILGTLSKKADDQKVNDLANVVDALPPTKNMLRYVWALTGKAWPFGG